MATTTTRPRTPQEQEEITRAYWEDYYWVRTEKGRPRTPEGRTWALRGATDGPVISYHATQAEAEAERQARIEQELQLLRDWRARSRARWGD